jgi:hypothetical protein
LYLSYLIIARTILGVEVKRSVIEGAGLGLFATRDFTRHEVVAPYRGKISPVPELGALGSEYAAENFGQNVLDADTSCRGRKVKDLSLWFATEM